MNRKEQRPLVNSIPEKINQNLKHADSRFICNGLKPPKIGHRAKGIPMQRNEPHADDFFSSQHHRIPTSISTGSCKLLENALDQALLIANTRGDVVATRKTRIILQTLLQITPTRPFPLRSEPG